MSKNIHSEIYIKELHQYLFIRKNKMVTQCCRCNWKIKFIFKLFFIFTLNIIINKKLLVNLFSFTKSISQYTINFKCYFHSYFFNILLMIGFLIISSFLKS